MSIRGGRNRARHCFTALALLLANAPTQAQDLLVASLADLSLEELSNLEITSVSKRPERLSDAAASVFVITNDEIRRSGVTSLPEALRLAPNLQVTRSGASGYIVSARGFSSSGGTPGNKMLVLIDGRSIYTPLFAGVFWEMQDVMLEDIDRIEVISGPGGTLWGVNAVNGVINIITHSAKDTQGGLASAGWGNREAQGAVRYGGRFGENGNYRVYAKRAVYEESEREDGTDRRDGWYNTQVGFRADWGEERDQFTVNGNAYQGSVGQPEPGALSLVGAPQTLDTIFISGLNLTARWARSFEDGSNINVQAYYDRTVRDSLPAFDEKLDIFDLQFQHTLKPMGPQTLTWGMEYRYGFDRVDEGTWFSFHPNDVKQQWVSLFAQDDIALSNTWRLTLGARLERNSYTGNEFLPNARLAWKFAPDHLLWTAASRAVRAPSRIDGDLFANHPAAPGITYIGGGPDIKAEKADVYELGYRGQPTVDTSLSMTVFHSKYYRLRTLELINSGNTLLAYENKMEGEVNGFEMWGTYEISSSFRVRGGYTKMNKNLRLKASSSTIPDLVSSNTMSADPDETWMLRASLDFSAQTEFDITFRHVSALEDLDVPSYNAVDVRIAWNPRPGLELSVTGQNLFVPRHVELRSPGPASSNQASEFDKSVFFKVVTRF